MATADHTDDREDNELDCEEVNDETFRPERYLFDENNFVCTNELIHGRDRIEDTGDGSEEYMEKKRKMQKRASSKRTMDRVEYFLRGEEPVKMLSKPRKGTHITRKVGMCLKFRCTCDPLFERTLYK